MSSTDQYKNIVVVGAGVVGLTTALNIQEKGGYNMTIVAETFPTDPKSIHYTSIWAGAHHVSHAEGDPKQEAIDQETFKVFWEMSAAGGEAEGCFMRLPQRDFYYDGRDSHLDWYPDFKKLPESELISGSKCGVSFTTLTIDTPRYLNYLLSKFLSKGGSIVRSKVQHLDQVAIGGAGVFTLASTLPLPKVDAIVACPGLGARSLGGVEDKDVYPVKGQVVILRAPWVKSGWDATHLEDSVWTYVIPRRSGDIIVGGTKVDNDWYPSARRETTLDILQRVLTLCPEVAPPSVRAERTPTVDDLIPLIVEECVGFRPGRKGGIRIEVGSAEGQQGKKIPVVFNYGHGGAGYQSSWGTASIAVDLLEKSLAKEK